MPAWAAASEKVAHDRVRSLAGVTPGSTRELPDLTTNPVPNRSLPVNRLRTSAAAALNVLCPETCSGNAGDTRVSSWKGAQAEPSTTIVPLLGPPQASTFLPA